MRDLLESPLLAAARWLDLPAVVGRQHAWTWRDIHGAALELTQRLDAGSTVCNLCTTRAGFLIASLAAMRCGCSLVLPPSGGAADMDAVLAASERAIVVCEDAGDLPHQWQCAAPCVMVRSAWQPGSVPDEGLAWQPRWDDLAVRLYTSGSTGAPQSQPKSLRELASGALVLGERLAECVPGGIAALRHIVCSVPAQHMFGLETSVMLSIAHGIPVLERRPLLPADVQEALGDAPGALWVTTPVHLRGMQRSGGIAGNCSAVLASTMPLGAVIARQVEDALHAPVLEIYGSTETGALALRRTAHDTNWHPLRGVSLESRADGALARGVHFASPQSLADRVELHADGGFTLLGRQSDLIKIGGRRASLAGLNQLLTDLPGLDDGVFHQPTDAGDDARLCLIYAGAELDAEAVRGWLRPRIDPVFLPRHLIRVARLPRSDSGKLPREALDRIHAQWRTAAAGAAPPACGFDVPAEHPCLPGHFPGRPIVPGVVLLERVMAHVEAATGQGIAQVQQSKFLSPLMPGEPAFAEFHRQGSQVGFSVSARRGGASVTLASGSLRLAPRPGDDA